MPSDIGCSGTMSDTADAKEPLDLDVLAARMSDQGFGDVSAP
jgi:hypothetical protein